MSLDLSVVFSAFAAALGVAILLMLLIRSPAKPDPAVTGSLTRVQDHCDRQAERLAALPAEIRAEITARTGDVAERLTAGLLDQTKAIHATLADRAQRQSEEFSKAQARQEEHRSAQADGAAALRRDVGVAVSELKAALVESHSRATQADGECLSALRTGLETLKATQGDAAAALQRDLLAISTATKAALADAHARAAQADSDCLATLRGELEALRTIQAETEGRLRKAIADDMVVARDLIDRKAKEAREDIEAKLKDMRESNDNRLADIQKTVNEQLQSAVEKQMAESFTRVIDQFAAVQKAMGDVQAVTGQIGDLKRLFSNVKARGGWGEAQVKAVLDDILPPGSYEVNVRLRDDSNDTVEFAILMPTGGEQRVRLPVDAKFPVEDYERLLRAREAGDAEAEAQARKGLDARIRQEAAKIAKKYVCPPITTEFAVMYLPTEGLYAEVAHSPGLIDDLGRSCRVFVAGPSLLPAMLRTIQLGHVTLALSKNAESVKDLLAATKSEMAKMDSVLERLGKQVGTVSNTIGDARTRTRAIARKLKAVEALPEDRAAALLGIEGELEDEDEEVV